MYLGRLFLSLVSPLKASVASPGACRSAFRASFLRSLSTRGRALEEDESLTQGERQKVGLIV